MTDKEAKLRVEDAYQEAESGWQSWMQEAEEDDKMYLGDQWSSANKSRLMSQNRPAITVNKIKKIVDMTTGHEMQNRTDLKYRPENKADALITDVYTELAKFVTTRSFCQYNTSFAFSDTCRVGLGWIAPTVNYYEDPADGDIDVGFENKYRIMMDPYTTDPRLTDCGYIIRSAWLSKDKAMELYPKIKKDIKRVSGINVSKFTTQFPANWQERGERVQVIEMWERSYEKKIILMDVQTREVRIWDGSKKKLNDIMQINPEAFASLITFERYVPGMNLITLVNDEILVHNGKPPTTHSQTMYPFIPIFGYYVPNFNDWKWKLQGIPRVLKDPQREFNKTRSLQMEAQYSVPSSGWVYREGVLDNPEELDKIGARQKIKMSEGGLGDGLWPVPPVTIQPAFVQLEQQHKEDLRDSGPDTNLMNLAGDRGLSPDTSGVAIQMAQKKELTSIQNVFDGKALAMRLLGKYMMEQFNKWSTKKIERIIGRQLPQEWDKMKSTSRMDAIVSEIESSPTYRMTSLATLQGFVQHGIQIPPQVIRELADIPEETRALWGKIEQQQQQQAQQAKQMEMQLKEKEINTVYKGELQKKQLDTQGKKEVEVLDQQGDEKIKRMDVKGKLALEALKQRGEKDNWKKPSSPWNK